MAPTKPLVAQQVEACYDVMGIPQSDTSEMTGMMLPRDRKNEWESKRVFYLTPQILTNDIQSGREFFSSYRNNLLIKLLQEHVRHEISFVWWLMRHTGHKEMLRIVQW
jgi:hypothetical protein